MSDDDTARGASIGMYLEIQRDIWPQLFDDLVRLSKGTARVQRLRALAYAGLIAERRLLAEPVLRDHVAPPEPERMPAQPRGAEGIFDAPLTD